MSAFHIHIDAADLPRDFELLAKESFGFHDDDFEHSLTVGGRELPGPVRHLTRKLTDRSSRELVRSICERLREECQRTGMKGYIQAEYIMEERVLSKSGPGQGGEAGDRAGFQVRKRRLDPARGEIFKKHEMHLELDPARTSPRVIEELAATGLLMTQCPSEITFTASGHPNGVRRVRESLLRYLARTPDSYHGKLVTEATVFSSLHGVTQLDLPEIVDGVQA